MNEAFVNRNKSFPEIDRKGKYNTKKIIFDGEKQKRGEL